MIASRLKRLFTGGSAGNEQLTLALAALLLVMLAVEGATILQIGPLLTVHAFVGMLLMPVVVLKVASTGWAAGALLPGRRGVRPARSASRRAAGADRAGPAADNGDRL